MASEFYPCVYFQKKPYAKAALKESEQYGANITPAIAERLAAKELLNYFTSVGTTPESFGAKNLHVISQEMQGLLIFMQWALTGKRVISVSASLTQAFSLSDCGDMCVRDVFSLEKPEVFYIHFQGLEGEQYLLDDGCQLVGAYVYMAPGTSLRIVLCSNSPADRGPLTQWRERYDLRILAPQFDIPVQDAIAYALSADLVDIAHAKQKMIDKAGSEGSLVSADILAERMTKGQSAYQAAASLILNALAYQKLYEPVASLEWPANTPPNLAKQAKAGSPNEKQRATSKLWGLGYVPFSELGRHFILDAQGTSHGTIRSHWRKGHWRNQPHGPKLGLRKLIWIWPVLVGADHTVSEPGQ